MNSFRYDVVVVGAGSGGFAAARTARALGSRVALVDEGPLGGLCILRGCMPSKTLIASSDIAQEIRESAVLGVEGGEPQIDLAKIFARKRQLIDGFADYRIAGIADFPLYNGPAVFESATRIRVGSDVVLDAKNVIVATGSVVAPAAVMGLEEAGFIDSDVVLDRERLPRSIVVLGGGYVGSELGQFLARMGVATTFVIRAGHLLSTEDGDVGHAVTEAFRHEGIDVRSGAVITRVEVDGARKRVHYIRAGNDESVEADEIFYAMGRVPRIAGLSLEAAGVEAHPITGITVGADLRTNVPNIFAVGDVTGVYPLVHVAIYQGEIAARNAVLGTSEVADYRLQRAHAIFTDPQVAIVGQTEKDLTAAGIPYLSASYPFSEHGKSVAINKTKGFVKMLASPVDGRILGGAIVGHAASDLIHELIVAMHFGATAADFARIPHLHPTIAEILTYPAEEIAERIAREPQIAVA